MVCFSTIIPVAVLAAVASAQVPFPIAFSSAPQSQIDAIASEVSTHFASLATEAAVTSLIDYMATATALPPDVQTAFADAGGDPLILAGEFFSATATPNWLGEIPTQLADFVSSAANAEATIAESVVGGGGAATGAPKTLVVAGTVMGALLAGALLL